MKIIPTPSCVPLAKERCPVSTQKQLAGNASHNADTVAALPVRGSCSTMCQPSKRRQRLFKNVWVESASMEATKPTPQESWSKPLIDQGWRSR